MTYIPPNAFIEENEYFVAFLLHRLTSLYKVDVVSKFVLIKFY